MTLQNNGSTATSPHSGVPYDAGTMQAMIPNAADTFKYFASISTTISIDNIPGGD